MLKCPRCGDMNYTVYGTVLICANVDCRWLWNPEQQSQNEELERQVGEARWLLTKGGTAPPGIADTWITRRLKFLADTEPKEGE